VLQVKDLSFFAGKKQILQDLNLTLSYGQFVSIIGPNGAGKSTFLKCLAAVTKPTSGVISIDGVPLNRLKNEERAKTIGYVPQHFQQSFPMSVREYIMLGRKPYIKWNVTNIDQQIVEQTLQYLKLENLQHNYVDELSGGERQRTSIARALVQQPTVFMLDEPISALDIKHQIQVLNSIKQLANDNSLVVVVLHDLELAARYSDYVVLMNQGKIYKEGNPVEVITEQSLREVYEVYTQIRPNDYGLDITVIGSV